MLSQCRAAAIRARNLLWAEGSGAKQRRWARELAVRWAPIACSEVALKSAIAIERSPDAPTFWRRQIRPSTLGRGHWQPESCAWLLLGVYSGSAVREKQGRLHPGVAAEVFAEG